MGLAGSRLHHSHPLLGSREPQAQGGSSEVRRGDSAVGRGTGPSTWVPLPPAPGRSLSWACRGQHRSALSLQQGPTLDVPSSAPGGCCLGPASSLPASHCLPPGPLISPTKWLESSWFLDPRSAAGVLPGVYLLLLSTCCHWEASLPCLPSPLSWYRPVVIFLCLLAGATPSLLTALLSLGDCKAPEPGPQECVSFSNWLSRGSHAPDPASPSWLEQRFYGDVGSPWTPPFLGVGGTVQSGAAAALTSHHDTNSGDFRALGTVSPLHSWVSHAQIQPNAY